MKLQQFNEEQKEQIINFGAFSYPIGKMAAILIIEKSVIKEWQKDENSEFEKLYQKGVHLCDYVLDLKLFEMAQLGDLKALQQFEFRKTKRTKK